jgi:hypothetical protein
VAKTAPLLNIFSGGELDALLDARSDIARVGAGCRTLENFICLVEGPITRRPGFADIRSVKDPSARAWLSTFEFNSTDNYILEWGDRYLRLFIGGANPGVLLNPNGTEFEVATPYLGAALTTADGTFALGTHQEGDVIYLAHASGKVAPQQLSRRAALTWDVLPYDYQGGPWQDYDTSTTQLQPAAAFGSNVIVAADKPTFTPDMIGTMLRLHLGPNEHYKAWEPGIAKSSGDEIYSDGKYYVASNSATTGTLTPTHTEGIKSDGKVDWEYEHSGYGWAVITFVNGPKAAKVTVLSDFPSIVVANGTFKWQLGAWSPKYGYPKAVGAGFGRLLWGQGRSLFFSGSDDFANFEDLQAGRVVASAGFRLDIPAAVDIRTIERLGQQLLVGTDGGEWLVKKLTDTEAFGPANVETVRQTGYGCARLPPLTPHGRVLFVERFGRRIFEQTSQLRQDYSQGIGAVERSDMARHLLRDRVVDWAWQGDRHSLVWLATGAGELVSALYEPDQQVLGGFSRHPLGGGATVESVATMPGLDRTEVWAIVRLGDRKRLARMAPIWRQGDAIEDAYYVDLGATYAGVPISVVTNCSQLEGYGVVALCDGMVVRGLTVASGQIVLPRAAGKVSWGLPYASFVDKRSPEGGGSYGTAQTRTSRTSRVSFALQDSMQVRGGPARDKTDLIDRRRPDEALGGPGQLLQGAKQVYPWPGGYGRGDPLCCLCEDPGPATLLAIVPDSEVYEP